MTETSRWLFGGVGTLAGGYVAIMAAMMALEPKLVFPAPVLDPAWLSSEARLAGAEELHLETSDGESLYGWWLPAAGPHAVVFFSGNATSVGLDPQSYARWRAEGVSVLHVNYRGYPGSTGAPSEAGLRVDALTAWTWLRERRAAQDIVVVGRSLGGGVAVGLAAQETPRGLVLLATYSSAVQVARDSYPWLPVGLLMRNRFDSVALAPGVGCPTVIVHGRDDAMIGPHHPPALAAALPTPPALHWVEGRDHNDPLLTDPVAWDAVRALFR
jgi:uncharacterized protein